MDLSQIQVTLKLLGIPTIKNSICLITGASSGIGAVTARELAQCGGTVVLVCRDEKRGRRSLEKIQKSTGNQNVHLLLADLSSLSQVRRLSEEFNKRFDHLDILVNNAGFLPGKREITREGFEKTFCVNYLAPFLLTQLLMNKLKKSASARIINVSTQIHHGIQIPWDDLTFKHRFGCYRAYRISKLALVMFTHELAKRLSRDRIDNITVNSLHPGLIASHFGDSSNGFIRNMIKWVRLLLLSSDIGAATSLYLATSPNVEGISGKYFVNKTIKEPSFYSKDENLCEIFWDMSTGLVRPWLRKNKYNLAPAARYG